MTGTEHGDGSEPGRTAELVITVPEMDCPSCAGKVGKGLGRVDGVLETDVRPTSGTVRVSYDPDRTDENDLIAAIEGAGYAVIKGADPEGTGDGGADSPREETEPEIAAPAEVWRSDRAIRTWIGAAFLTVGLLLEFVATGRNAQIVAVAGGGVSAADLAFLVAVLSSGVPVVRSGYYSARNRSLDIDLLMGTAIVAATVIGLFVEAATLAVLFSIAELLERYAMDRTRDSLRELMELAPNEATVLRDGEQITVVVDEVRVGDRVAIRPGEKVPVDGVVREGSSAVDQSPITGESVPVDKAAGDGVYAGTLNEAGYLEVETTSAAADSTLSRVIDLVREAQAKKTEKEQFVDRFAGYYTPVVVALAVLTVLVPPLAIDGTATVALAGVEHTFAGDRPTWFVRGLTLLVIACPCAFVISTPVSVASGVTAAARNGVLIKGGNHLEAMGNVDVVAFDKTGTLTAGELTVTDIVPADGSNEADVLRVAGALERRSEHPIAGAILERADADAVDPPEATEFESHTGKGVQAQIDGETYYAGNPGLFAGLGFDPPESDGSRGVEGTERIDGSGRTDGGASRVASDRGQLLEDDTISSLQRAGKTVVLVGTADRLIGAIAIADEVRPAAKGAVANLRRLGVERVVMLTGDNDGTARAAAEAVGIDEYRAELLPEDKVDAVEGLEATQGSVAMVGDGVNDAPAMATATVSVAMGAAGTDTAIETGDIALMGDEIAKLPYLYALSNEANDVIRQNVWSSLGVKALLAVGVPFGYVSVAIAVVVGDMGMSLGVTGNAMRLSRIKPERYLDD